MVGAGAEALFTGEAAGGAELGSAAAAGLAKGFWNVNEAIAVAAGAGAGAGVDKTTCMENGSSSRG